MIGTEPDCRNVVAGELIEPAGSALPVWSPWTGERLADAVCVGPEAVDLAVGAARSALPGWLATTPKDRSERLLELAALVDVHGDDLALLESQDVGKPLAWAREEIPICVDVLRYFAGAARVLEGAASAEYAPDSTSVLRREPIGVVGLITPWNYPLLEAVWKIAPALAAGNTCVLKPSELTPLTTLALARLTRDVLPPGVLNAITGDGRPTGEAIVRHPDVGMAALTGSVESGKKVAAAAADTLKRFLVGPVGSEITGIAETPDGKALFINIQHPGESGGSTWPQDDGFATPRSATVVISKNDGGVIGS